MLNHSYLNKSNWNVCSFCDSSKCVHISVDVVLIFTEPAQSGY